MLRIGIAGQPMSIIWLKHTDSMRNLASLLRRQGKSAEAEYWDRMAAEHEERINRNEGRG
jgi:hypothetical protein